MRLGTAIGLTFFKPQGMSHSADVVFSFNR